MKNKELVYHVKDFVHYFVVFAVIALSWVPLMNKFGVNVWLTSSVVFVEFIVADKIMHKILKIK